MTLSEAIKKYPEFQRETLAAIVGVYNAEQERDKLGVEQDYALANFGAPSSMRMFEHAGRLVVGYSRAMELSQLLDRAEIQHTKSSAEMIAKLVKIYGNRTHINSVVHGGLNFVTAMDEAQ